MSIYNERKRQQQEDAQRAAEVSPTAFIARDKDGNEVGIYDYGKDAGAGLENLPEPSIQAGVKHGCMDEFRAFLQQQTDPISLWLAQVDPIKERREFNRRLSEWVRKWEKAGLIPPQSLQIDRKTL